MKKTGCFLTALFLGFGIYMLGYPLSVQAQESQDKVSLGKAMFFDPNLSVNRTQSCADCHVPMAGFTGPESDTNDMTAVYEGAVLTRFGNRKPPTSAYCGESPVLYYDEASATWFGGMFWDGRATGAILGDPLAEQAMGPFLNPLEQAMPNPRLVCIRVAESDYAALFETVWGEGSLDFVKDVSGTYERIARSIAAYERSAEVNPFTSKFDAFWENAKDAGKDITLITAAGIPGAMMGGGGGGMGPGGGGGGMGPGGGGGGGMGPGGGGGMGTNPGENPARWEHYRGLGLTDDELKGLAVFNDPNRGNCASCHTLTEGSAGYPLFTDFSHHNLGIPKNPDNPFYDMPKKWNPDGEDWVDYGLGGYLKTAGYEPAKLEPEMGKFKTPTLRNVDLRPYPEFVKSYGHNGFFKNLDQMDGIIHFYAWRAMIDRGMDGGPGMVNMFPAPEVDENRILMQPFNFMMNGPYLTAFMKTLSDGYFER